MDSCENCNAWKLLANDTGVCRAKSPVPFVVGMQQGQVKGLSGQRTASPVVATVYPETHKDQWCREHVLAEMMQPLDWEKLPGWENIEDKKW